MGVGVLCGVGVSVNVCLQVPNSADEGGVDDGLLGGGQDVS